MDDIVGQCPGVLAIHDNVFIYWKDDDANIINLFNVAKKEGLIFNSEKCSIKQDSDILWQCVLSQWILTRPRKDPRQHRDDTPSNEAGTTIIFRSGKLSSNICPPSQSSH